ncbi:unnamed protein product [Linum trigynum]|uniref:Uncharacterized protein n=1 Tax=Linum trigynum TaxID=586398 RepID=A0AAV2GL55_9ROSI
MARTQKGDVEDRMNTTAGRKSEAVRHLPNALDDGVRPEIATSKFLGGPTKDRMLTVGMELQVDQVANSKCQVTVTTISLLLHAVLGLAEIELEFIEDSIAVEECLIDLMDRCGTRPVEWNERGKATVQRFKRRHTCCAVEGAVVPELSPREEHEPTARVLVRETAEELFEATVDDLGLPIRLGMIGGGHGELGTGESEQLTLEVAGEGPIAVANNRTWKTMEADDPSQESISNRTGCVRVRKRQKVGRFREPIDHHQNHRFAIGGRKPVDEIHRNIFPNLGGNR